MQDRANRTSSLSWVSVILSILLTVPILQAQSLRTIDVPGAGETVAGGINKGKIIVGYYSLPGSDYSHAFALLNGEFKLFDVPRATQTRAYAINDHNQVLGTYTDTSRTHGFVYHAGVLTTMDFPNAENTYPAGINNAGQVVGTYVETNGLQHGFIYTDGHYKVYDVPISNARWTGVEGINNKEDIVGYFMDKNEFTHGFSLVGNVFTQVDVPGSYDFTVANGVNDDGDIVGSFGYYGGGPSTGYILKNKAYRKIQVPQSISTESYGLNDADVIVGSFSDSSDLHHGYVVIP